MSGRAGPSSARPDPYAREPQDERRDPYAQGTRGIITSLGPNAHYPEELQSRARYVTKTDGWAGHFSRNVNFVHRNQRYDHRFYKRKRKKDHVKKEDRRIPSVHDYMNDYDGTDIYEINRLTLMPLEIANKDLPANRRAAHKDTLEGSWTAAWNHLGRNAVFNDPAPSLPCDTLYLRHITEAEYQRRLNNLFADFARHVEREGTADGYGIEDIRSLLPRPITVYYLFREYYDWVEDTSFEKRKRCPKGEDILSFYISWSNINMHAVPLRLRHEVYMQTPADIRSIEPSDVLPTPSAPAVAYTTGHYHNAGPELRRLYAAYYKEEQVEMNITSLIYAGMYGIHVSRASDPRLTTSDTHGIICGIPQALVNLASADVFVDLFYNSPVDPASALLMVWRCYEIDWDACDHPETPFFYYNFQDGSVHDLPQAEEREPQFDNSKKERPLKSWCVRVWKPQRVVWKKHITSYRTYAQCKEQIDTVLRHRGWIPEPEARNDPTEVQPPPVAENARYVERVEAPGNWLNGAVEALRPILREFSANEPRNGDEFVDWVRGMLARRRQLETDLDTRNNTINEHNNTITTLRETLRNTEAKVQAEKTRNERLAGNVTTAKEAQQAAATRATRTETQLNQALQELGRRRESEREEHETALQTIEGQLTTLQESRNADVRNAVATVEQQLEALRGEYEQSLDDNANYAGQVSRLEANERNLTAQVDNLTTSRNEWRQAANALHRNFTAARTREVQNRTSIAILQRQLRMIRRGTDLTMRTIQDAAQAYTATSTFVTQGLTTANDVSTDPVVYDEFNLPEDSSNDGSGAAGSGTGGAAGGAPSSGA